MNISGTKLRIGAAVAAALGLAACGGCGGGGTASQPPTSSNPPPATSTKVSASGVITGFGSVYVNGVRYDTSAADIEFEDEGRKSEDALRLGMKVKVEGEREGDNRRADRIRYDDDLEGPVSAIQPDAANPSLGSFTVAGQDVTVDDNTVFDDSIGDNNGDGSTDLLDLDPANGMIVVEVSGFQTEGGILATRVERDDDRQAGDEDDAEVKGYVTDLDETAGTFRIRALTVAWTPDDLDSEDFPDGTLSEDLFVEVEGTLLADGTLDADSIEREDDFGRGDDDEGEFEIEGILQAVDTASSPNTITIDGNTIPVGDASRLTGHVGERVELEGTFDADGVLILDDGDDGVKFERENSVRTEDRVETVGTGSFFTRLGLEITPTGAPRRRSSHGCRRATTSRRAGIPKATAASSGCASSATATRTIRTANCAARWPTAPSAIPSSLSRASPSTRRRSRAPAASATRTTWPSAVTNSSLGWRPATWSRPTASTAAAAPTACSSPRKSSSSATTALPVTTTTAACPGVTTATTTVPAMTAPQPTRSAAWSATWTTSRTRSWWQAGPSVSPRTP